MYYIEADIEFLNGIDKLVYGFHYISKYSIDYINKILEVEISSSPSKQEWLDSGYYSPYVSFFELDKVPDFNMEPSNYILRTLVTKTGTVFYGLKVQKDYNLLSLGEVSE